MLLSLLELKYFEIMSGHLEHCSEGSQGLLQLLQVSALRLMNKSRGILFINCTNTYFVYSKILGAVLGD
jgi:hypothetical protein